MGLVAANKGYNGGRRPVSSPGFRDLPPGFREISPDSIGDRSVWSRCSDAPKIAPSEIRQSAAGGLAADSYENSFSDILKEHSKKIVLKKVLNKEERCFSKGRHHQIPQFAAGGLDISIQSIFLFGRCHFV